MSSSKNLEQEKTSFLNKSNSAFIEDMYVRFIENDPNLKALLETEVKTLTIFGKTWQLHSKHGLGISDIDNAKLIEQSVSFLSRNGVRVIFDAEHFFDGYLQSEAFALDMLDAAVNGGADTLVLCDTNGGSLPNYVYDTTKKIVDRYKQPIGVHCHNDSGLAAANTLMAVSAGALHVQGTINGVGERCGNVSLATVLPNLVLKMNKKTKTKLNLSDLSSLVKFTYDIMNMHPDTQAPFIGKSAFAHKGGIHVSAVMKDSNMYEHIDPKLVGNKQRVLVSDLSGKSNISFKANELDIKYKDSKEITGKFGLGFIYKTSFDKANRTSLKGKRGAGLEASLPVFDKIKKELNVPILTDIHNAEQCEIVSKHVDVLQIPAFLCRQTDLLIAAAKTNKIINVKKGQFLAPWDMVNVTKKISESGNDKILVTERGASFGYNTLVSDMRSLPIMAKNGYPVIFDATHSVQQPGGQGESSGGQREFVEYLARAAVAVGVAGVFIETHQDPDNAPSDGPNMVPLNKLENLLKQLHDIDNLIKK